MVNIIKTKNIPAKRRRFTIGRSRNETTARTNLDLITNDIRNIEFRPLQIWEIYKKCNVQFYTSEKIANFKKYLNLLKYHSEFSEILNIKRPVWSFDTVERFYVDMLSKLEDLKTKLNYEEIFTEDNVPSSADISNAITNVAESNIINDWELDYIVMHKTEPYEGNGCLSLEDLMIYGKTNRKTTLIYTSLYILSEVCGMYWWFEMRSFHEMEEHFQLDFIEEMCEIHSEEFNDKVEEARAYNKSDWKMTFNKNYQKYKTFVGDLKSMSASIEIMRSVAFKSETNFTIWLRAILWLKDNEFTITKFSFSHSFDNESIYPSELYAILPDFDGEIIDKMDNIMSGGGCYEPVGLSSILVLLSNGSKIEVDTTKYVAMLDIIFGFNHLKNKYNARFTRFSNIKTICDALFIQKLGDGLRRDCES